METGQKSISVCISVQLSGDRYTIQRAIGTFKTTLRVSEKTAESMLFTQKTSRRVATGGSTKYY